MAFGKCIQVDIKYLTDIPELTGSLRHGKHPKYGEFLEQAAEYQRYFNCGRQNSYRNATPLQLLEQRNTEIDPAILQLRPIEVDTLLISDALNRWKLWQKFEDSS